MDPNPSSSWESILEKVKHHIPTVDFDSTSPENEELVTIYQRPAGHSLKIPEDIESFSVDDDELEELVKSTAQSNRSEEVCGQSGKSDDHKTVEDTTTTQCSDADIEAQSCKGCIVEMNRAKLEASEGSNLDKTKSDEGFPVLSFARLDQWDLDEVLQNLQEDRLSLHQYVSTEPEKTHADGEKDRSKEDIMKKLVALYDSQSTISVSKPVKSQSYDGQKHVWNKSSVKMEAELQSSHHECPTVYIDLRCPDPSVKPTRTSSNISSESKPAAKHNTHRESPPTQKPKLKVHNGSQMKDREVTGKSMLLQKIKEMKKKRGKNLSKYTNPSYSVPGNKVEELEEKLPHPELTCRHESHHLLEDNQSSHVQFEYRNPKMESPPTAQQSTIKEPKQQSNQQVRQVKQIQLKQHQQILKRLEKHRPTKSVNQKQPAAERTNVLFDFEASHLEPISTLPAYITKNGCMLLIVNLASPGMVGQRNHGKKKHLYPAETRSHIYSTIVAWFLSLVGPDPRHDDEDEAGAKYPFWVAGLQQLWMEDGLALHVLAVARHCYTSKNRAKDIHAPFYNHVCRFLSETSLSLIAEREDLRHRASASLIRLPSVCLNRFISATSNQKVIDRTFGLSPGFYWQTVETQECVCKGSDATLELHIEVSVALGCKAFFLHPSLTHYTLQLLLESGLDVCGLRLLYPPQGLLSNSAGAVPVIQKADDNCQPVLALAVRGPHAHSVLKDLTRSLDHLLLRKTDPTSLNSVHCRGQEPPLLYSPRLVSHVHRELCLWFSGKLGEGSAQNDNQPLNRILPSDDRVKGSLSDFSRSPSFLCATTKADLLLVVSPVVPPCCYGQVLAVCERRGFGLKGLQRLQLHSPGAAVLGLTNQQALVFCSPHPVTLNQEELMLPSHCLVLLLTKENAIHHSVSLPAALMRELKAQNLMSCILSRPDGVYTVEPSFCFHTVPYSSDLFHIFVRCMWAVPDPFSVTLSRLKCSSNSNMEQVVILTLCGKDMSRGLSLLHRVLTKGPEGFKLSGLKFLPGLTRLQAQELSPYEVGEPLCNRTMDRLMSSPALVCALQRVDAFASLRKLLPHNYLGNLRVLMSSTPEVAFRQASLFFFEHDLIPDHRVPPLLKAFSQKCSAKDPQLQLTVCLIKPRNWSSALTIIVNKLQLNSLALVGLRVVTLNKGNATSLLPAESVTDPADFEAHVEFLCSGSSLALCLEGEDAVRRLLDVLDQEDSSLWTTCDGTAHSYKSIYGSGSYQKAIRDVRSFFPEGLCCPETSTMRQEQILHMCSDPLASVERERSCRLTSVGHDGGSLIHSAPWQTTCLLIPVNTPPLSTVPSHLYMLEQLLRSGCHLVAGRMSMLDDEQRKHIAEILSVSSRGDKRMAQLSQAPCLILALQGETPASHFNLILKSIYKENSDPEKVGKMIIYPKNEKVAKQLICYLFDVLSPESCLTVVP